MSNVDGQNTKVKTLVLHLLEKEEKKHYLIVYIHFRFAIILIYFFL
jgi:hypothetical protein